MTDKVDIVQMIRKKFYKRMEEKFFWAREEVKLEFEAAVAEALSRMIYERENRENGK